MAKKGKKFKTSSIKRTNQLRTKLLKQGKLKTRRHRSKPKKVHRPPQQTVISKNDNEEQEDSSEHEDDMANMIEEEDMSYLKNVISNKTYNLTKNWNINGKEERKPRKQKRKAEDVDEAELLEAQYEESVQQPESKRKKYLLPLKTSEGIVLRSEEVSESEDEEVQVDEEKKSDEATTAAEDEDEDEEVKEVSAADLLALRQNSVMKCKFRIGSLCSGLTENPELKMKNFKELLEMFYKNESEVCLTAKKLVLVSLLEVFKDLLPEYQIKHHVDPKVKLKKDVKQLYTYESELLKYYKEYLKMLEKTVTMLKRKKGDSRVFKEPQIKYAEMSLQCLCDLLTSHPYFNFSKNIIHLLVPFLNNSRESARTIVSNAIKEIFKTDKRGEVSLEVVRNINKLVKSKVNIVHSEVLSVCLMLKLKDVNLDKEKEEELKKKKELAKNYKFMKLSKRERKRKKKFQDLEKELLETKAEENKKSKDHFMTEITKILFTIYFRILKLTPNSKLLSAALEGLAKFAHCINFEFYHDLIVVINSLIQNENLGYKEILSCVQTVFTVLYYQGATINIDPIKFYSHFYANLLKISAGRNHSDLPVILKTADFVLLKRRKHVSLQRLLAFTKRLTALALLALPNGTLALLCLVKQILQVNNATDSLLDFESGQGQGVYYPEINEPEYCNAGATSLWEGFLLQRHYHPTVKEYARLIANIRKPQDSSQVKNFLNLTPDQFFEQFDPTLVKFNPPVPSPKKFSQNKKRRKGLYQEDFEDYIKKTLGGNLNFVNLI